jgi:hypothetical protein
MNAFTPIAPIVEARIDPRYTFLVRASIRLFLIDQLEMTLDEAFDGLVANLQCDCDRELLARWERDFPHRSRSKPRPRQRAAQSTLDAIVYTVRHRGIAALKEPKNLDRLARCNAEQRANLNNRIEKIISIGSI